MKNEHIASSVTELIGKSAAFACVPLCGSYGHFQRAAFEA